jgi:hypothetical protein
MCMCMLLLHRVTRTHHTRSLMHTHIRTQTACLASLAAYLRALWVCLPAVRAWAIVNSIGAFLVSASIGNDGTIAPIALFSEKGGECVVESPWYVGGNGCVAAAAAAALAS